MSYRRKFREDSITDDLGESEAMKCPKCGSEMEEREEFKMYGGTAVLDLMDKEGPDTVFRKYGKKREYLQCTNKKCGHEEKVKK